MASTRSGGLGPRSSGGLAGGGAVVRCSSAASLRSLRSQDDEVSANEEGLHAAATPLVAAPAAPAKSKRQLVLLPSVFEGRPPVLFFSYTVPCGAVQRPMDRAVPCDIDGPRLFYSHTDAIHEYNAVINMMRQGGLYRVKAETKKWMLIWSNHPSPEALQAMRPSQRTNHFPGSSNLGRKDLLWKNISRMQRRFGVRSYNITPPGYVLPKALVAWENARARQPDAIWIWKPCSASCGRGIRVLGSGMTAEEGRELGRKRGIVQRYVPNPLLIEGFKFDMRIYVVVVSYDPLKVYMNEEGLVRLATQKYSADPSTLESRTMHLTNYSVNKLSPTFVQNHDGREDCIRRRKETPAEEQGRLALAKEFMNGRGDAMDVGEDGPPASKWSLTELRQNFAERGLDYNLMTSRMKDVIIKTLLAVEPSIQAEWSRSLGVPDAGWNARGQCGAHTGVTSSCFEMYGFDILVDSDLTPWLLEVNICPSLSSGSPLDKRIKTKLVADTLTLVGIRPPPQIFRRQPQSFAKPSRDVVGMVTIAGKADDADVPLGPAPPAAELARRAAKLAAVPSALDAVAHFDELAWEIVLEAHDQDMRCGGLERIHPTAGSAKFLPLLASEESYYSVVLRRFYEAGGGAALFGTLGRDVIPPWVPRQICFEAT